MDKSLFFQRKPSPPPPTDLECLSGWVARLKLHLQKDQPSKHSPAIFRPCRMGSRALMRLSITYPYIVERITTAMESTQRRFEFYIEDGGELAEEDFCDAMFSLMERIEAAVKTIAEAEGKQDIENVSHVTQKTAEDEPNSANSASASRLFSGDVPENTDLIDLAVKLDAEAGKPETDRRPWNVVAREFTGEAKNSDSKAQSLLASLRRMKRQGRVNL